MSRWLPRDVTTMPLSQIDAEISSIEKTSQSDRTVEDVERLADLYAARRRITGGRHRGYW